MDFVSCGNLSVGLNSLKLGFLRKRIVPNYSLLVNPNQFVQSECSTKPNKAIVKKRKSLLNDVVTDKHSSCFKTCKTFGSKVVKVTTSKEKTSVKLKTKCKPKKTSVKFTANMKEAVGVDCNENDAKYDTVQTKNQRKKTFFRKERTFNAMEDSDVSDTDEYVYREVTLDGVVFHHFE